MCSRYSCGAYGREWRECCGGGKSCPQSGQRPELSQREYSFLLCLSQIPRLPLARFVLVSERSDYIRLIGLAPVYLVDEDETLKRIRETGELLTALEKRGLIAMDYGTPLQEYGYEAYRRSAAYRAFEASVRTGGGRDGFLFNRPRLELGYMELTPRGRQAAARLALA